MSSMQRLCQNLFGGWFQLHRRFPSSLLDEMAAVIGASERQHKGEIRFAVESRLPTLAVLEGLNAASRAHQVFARLRVWDTEYNSGVLIYVLMAEHRIEIVADRGIAAHVTTAEWAAICQSMRERYARGQWRQGSLDGIAAADALLLQHFAGNDKNNPDELPDRPVLL